MMGVTLREDIGIGDKLQFTSLPENYYRTHGKPLVDLSNSWVFDYNPFVIRDASKVTEKKELWNWPKQYEWPRPRSSVYQSNAEIHASLFKSKVFINRPRLYRYENEVAIEDRHMVLFHPVGKSNGQLPPQVIDHILKKYQNMDLFQIGKREDPDFGIPRIITDDIWDLVKVISMCRMLIGPDSGPAWIAACYPDVVVKKVRTRIPDGFGELKDWIPLEIDNHHSHWDERFFSIHNTTEDDVGFTQSFRRI